jgi:hypothetical protein
MPIVIISRPQVIDQYIFAAMTFIIVSLIFLPLVLLERKVIKKRIKNNPSSKDGNELLLHGWKNHKKFTEDGNILAIGIADVAKGKVQESLKLGTEQNLFLAAGVPGLKYKIDVMLNYTEAYKILGMTAPET